MPRQRCLFCGVFASDVPSASGMKSLACRDCFGQMGKLFSGREQLLRAARSEHCLSCGNGPQHRVLVAGIAAAICRQCYRQATKGSLPIPPGAAELDRQTRKRLSRSRAVRLEARRRVRETYRAARSIQRSSVEGSLQKKRIVRIAIKRFVAERAMKPRLVRVEGRRAPQRSPKVRIGAGQRKSKR